MELLIEIIFEFYVELMLLVIPGEDGGGKHIRFAKSAAVLMLFIVIALTIWGAVLISEQNSLFGLVPLAAAALLSLVQIIAGIVLYNRKQ